MDMPLVSLVVADAASFVFHKDSYFQIVIRRTPSLGIRRKYGSLQLLGA